MLRNSDQINPEQNPDKSAGVELAHKETDGCGPFCMYFIYFTISPYFDSPGDLHVFEGSNFES